MIWLLIDGHNVIFHTPELAQKYKKHPGAVLETLARHAQQLGDLKSWKVVLVFDGNSPQSSATARTQSVEILFCNRNQSADAIIEKLSHKIPPQELIYIVTADQALAAAVHSPRTYIFSVEWFLNEVEAAQSVLNERLLDISRKAKW